MVTSRITASTETFERHSIFFPQARKRSPNQQGSQGNPARSTFTCGGIGPSDLSGVGPKSITVGVPTAAATWLNPLSFPTTTPAAAMSSAVSRKESCPTNERT